MIVKDYRGNELLEIISVEEEKVDTKYEPINHCLAVVKVDSDYLLGWNKYRKGLGNIWRMQGEIHAKRIYTNCTGSGIAYRTSCELLQKEQTVFAGVCTNKK